MSLADIIEASELCASDFYRSDVIKDYEWKEADHAGALVAILSTFGTDFYRAAGLEALRASMPRSITISPEMTVAIIRVFDSDFHRVSAMGGLSPYLTPLSKAEKMTILSTFKSSFYRAQAQQIISAIKGVKKVDPKLPPAEDEANGPQESKTPDAPTKKYKTSSSDDFALEQGIHQSLEEAKKAEPRQNPQKAGMRLTATGVSVPEVVKVAEAADALACITCETYKANALCVPCNHASSCMQCTVQWNEKNSVCINCREPVTALQYVFF